MNKKIPISKIPCAWTIAGSDSSSCSGIQADLKTFHSMGVHGCSIVTAVTAQGINTFDSAHYIPIENIIAQIHSLQGDLLPKSIKIGMLGHATTIKELIRFLHSYHNPVILDPLLISSSGKQLFSGNIANYLTELKNLFPLVDILTPNLPEVEMLLGRSVQTYQDMIHATNTLLSLGIKNIVVKGGHFTNDRFSQDFWTNGNDSFWLTSSRYSQANYRGTGCTFSTAIAASLALGYEIKDAIVIAKMVINQAIRLAQKSQSENRLVYAGWPENEADLPYLTPMPLTTAPISFPHCGSEPLGLYPVVDNVEWLKKLLPLGVKTIQLRIKNKCGEELAREIQQGVQLANQYHAKLFINDYWQLAIRYHAYGVHLGQEDLTSANVNNIRQAGLRLGISTHCYYEVARAHTYKPSYIACGPIFPTTSKTMSFAPQGIENLQRWRRTLSYPLVAIGGINHEKLADVIATKVDGIAMISAITQAKDITVTMKELLQKVNS